MTAAFPLTWPPGLKRTPDDRREAGGFKTKLSAALKNVETALRLFGQDSGIPVSDVVLSSNVSLGVAKPSDPGVAVWFAWDGDQRCIAVDRYRTPEANLQAIFHVLEARRTEARHGTLQMVRASFEGLKALPAPPGRHWSEILGIVRDATPAQIEAAYLALAKKRHPDAGGSTEAMTALNRARDIAKRERGA